jgi:hypothetical protein
MATYHGTSPIPDSNSKTAERFSVQEIAWLVEYTNLSPPLSRPRNWAIQKETHLGIIPKTRSDNKLDLLTFKADKVTFKRPFSREQTQLTTGKTSDFVILGDVAVQTYVFEMFPNDVGGGVPLSSAFSRRLQVIKL